jgi:hypothetical protein
VGLCRRDERQIGHRLGQQKLEEPFGSPNIPCLTHPELGELGNTMLGGLPESVQTFEAG